MTDESLSGVLSSRFCECVAADLQLCRVVHSTTLLHLPTSSSAVAKRPRDASCRSAVSFNSTQRRVESFIVSYV